jgi:hypothetical protein
VHQICKLQGDSHDCEEQATKPLQRCLSTILAITLAKGADRFDTWSCLTEYGPSFCTAWLTNVSSQTARKVTWLVKRPQTQPAASFQSGEAKQETGKICQIDCLNSIVKVMIVTEISPGGYFLSKVEDF